MKIHIPNFLRWYPIMSLMLVGAIIWFCMTLYKTFKVENYSVATITGVQHLGSDYLIKVFYIDKYNGGVVGESGGGGGIMCCIKIPRKWYKGLKAEIRWQVQHIIRSNNPEIEDTAEAAGMYQAQVPVEAYEKPDDLYVHFFSDGRVRVVVSGTSPSWEGHPIQRRDARENLLATAGTRVSALFSEKEIDESRRQIARDRDKYGDWR